MKKITLIFKKIIQLIIIAVILLTAIGAYITYRYQDQIVQIFITEANKRINTPIKVEKITFSLIDHFPKGSIELKNVFIQESTPGSEKPLIKAKKIHLNFDLLPILKQKFVLNEVFIKQGEVFITIDKNAENNYKVINTSDSTASDFAFNLKKISLDKVLLNYKNYAAHSDYEMLFIKNQVILSDKENFQHVSIEGPITNYHIFSEDNLLLGEKDLLVTSEFDYYSTQKNLQFDYINIINGENTYSIKGDISIGKERDFDLSFESNPQRLSSISPHLPKVLSEKINQYQGKGIISFSGHIWNEYTSQDNPNINIAFLLKKGEIREPQYQLHINDLGVSGVWQYHNQKDSSYFKLKSFEGQWKNQPIKGNLLISDFDNYTFSVNLMTSLHAPKLFQVFKTSQFNQVDGNIKANINFSGNWDDLIHDENLEKVKSSGEITLENLNFTLVDYLPFIDLKGHFLFHNEELGISNFSGSVGNSDFLLNGHFKNIASFLFHNDHPLSIDADIKSRFIDIDELLKNYANDSLHLQDSLQPFKIAPYLTSKLHCNIAQTQFKNFRGRSINGDIFIYDEKARAQNLSINTAGGSVNINGIIDSSRDSIVMANVYGDLNMIHIDSVFYTFENFNQTFLIDDHLKGQVNAKVSTYLEFDKYLTLNDKKLISDINISIRNGQLLDFEPMQQLSRFVEEDQLANLSFSELKNDIHIENRTIYLPQMQVRSNVSTIDITGTHTFDQVIDYQLKVPLKNFKKRDRDTRFGEVEEVDGHFNIFLSIKGTTDDYKIALDKKAVKEKVKDDIRKEIKELKDIFRNKGHIEEDSVIELSEDDFFEF